MYSVVNDLLVLLLINRLSSTQIILNLFYNLTKIVIILTNFYFILKLDSIYESEFNFFSKTKKQFFPNFYFKIIFSVVSDIL